MQFVDKSNQLKEVEKTVYDFSDKLIDQISEARDKLILKITQRQWMGLQERNQKVKDVCLKAKNIQAMTGKDIALILEQKKRFDRKNQLKQFYVQVKDIEESFTQKIKDSFQLIEEKLQPNLASIEATQLKEKRVHWSKELKGPNIIIKGSLLKRDTSYNQKSNFTHVSCLCTNKKFTQFPQNIKENLNESTHFYISELLRKKQFIHNTLPTKFRSSKMREFFLIFLHVLSSLVRINFTPTHSTFRSCMPRYNNKIALLEPSIPRIGGNVIKWQMRIPKSAKRHWLAMGICLRYKIKLHNFDFTKYARYQSDHGCYVVSSTGHSWADNNPEQNQMMCSLTMNNNEIITMTLNVEAQTLHYRNESTEKQYTQKIKYDMEKNQGDEMQICALLQGMKDEVELLEVQNEKTVWKIQ